MDSVFRFWGMAAQAIGSYPTRRGALHPNIGAQLDRQAIFSLTESDVWW